MGEYTVKPLGTDTWAAFAEMALCKPFVQSVHDKRLFESILYGVQGTAMPSWIDYGLTKNDVGDIVNFVHSMNQKARSPQNAGN